MSKLIAILIVCLSLGAATATSASAGTTPTVTAPNGVVYSLTVPGHYALVFKNGVQKGAKRTADACAFLLQRRVYACNFGTAFVMLTHPTTHSYVLWTVVSKKVVAKKTVKV